MTGLDELTALPEYRNGGLLIDLGVICPRQPIDLRRPHKVSVGDRRRMARADRDADGPIARRRCGTNSGSITTFTLPQMLQGGTWSAGRKIALTLRPPGGPSPLPILADGTVF